MRRVLISIAVLLAAAAFIAGGWYGLRWFETRRADALLEDANAHIHSADDLMARMQTDRLGRDSFTSIDNINRAAAALQEMKPLLGEAASDVQDAQDDVSAAAGLRLIDDSYRAYLGKKEEAADLRRQQLDTLASLVDRLDQLYAVGPTVFNSVQEMDRLLGQMQTSMSQVQSSPQSAGPSLQQISASFTQLQNQLDQSYAQSNLQLISELSKSAADNAGLASLGAQLADAAGAGDQAKAQQIASQMEEKLMAISAGGDPLEPWWRSQVDPLQNQFSDLQTQQVSLDAEAASLYDAIK